MAFRSNIFVFILFCILYSRASLLESYFKRPCGDQKGSLKSTFGFNLTNTVDSLIQCAIFCNQNSNCLSLRLCPDDMMCEISKATLECSGRDCSDIVSSMNCSYYEKILNSEDVNDTNNVSTAGILPSHEIFIHDSSGVFTKGNSSSLLQYVQNGGRIQIRTDDILLEVSRINIKGNMVCAQSLFNFEFETGGMHRYFYYLCTDGKVQTQVWEIGQNTLLNNTVQYRQLTWFVSYMPVQSITPSGINFAEAIVDGAEIHIVLDDLIIRSDSVTVSDPTVYYQVIWEVSINKFLKIMANAYYYTRLISSSPAQVHTLRYYVETNSIMSASTASSTNIRWLMTYRWKMVLETNAEGQFISGCKSTFLSLVRNGHAVRVSFGNAVEEASMLWIKDGELWAQTLDSVLAENGKFKSNPIYRTVRMISTSGVVNQYNVHMHGGASHEISTKMSLKWYVDTSTWQTIHKNGDFLNTNNCLHLIEKASSLRVLMHTQTSDIFVKVDSVTVDQTTDSCTLRSFKHFKIDADSGNYTVTLPPAWSLMFMTNIGTVTEYARAYDKVENPTKFTSDPVMTWFKEE